MSLPLLGLAAEKPAPPLDASVAERFARLALACVHKEYPNHISHTLNSDADVAPPRKLTPAFCGCYDWHSSVHGHWLLARLARAFPKASFATDAREALRESLTSENIKRKPLTLPGLDGRVSKGPMGLPGCSNSRPNFANGMIRSRASFRQICARSRRWRWSGSQSGCPSFPTRCGSENTIRPPLRSV